MYRTVLYSRFIAAGPQALDDFLEMEPSAPHARLTHSGRHLIPLYSHLTELVVEVFRNLWPPRHIDPHPDPGGAHAVCSRTKNRRGHTSPLPCEVASGIRPHRQRHGPGVIYLPRPDS
jgi:hypothetical protein